MILTLWPSEGQNHLMQTRGAPTLTSPGTVFLALAKSMAVT